MSQVYSVGQKSYCLHCCLKYGKTDCCMIANESTVYQPPNDVNVNNSVFCIFDIDLARQLRYKLLIPWHTTCI